MATLSHVESREPSRLPNISVTYRPESHALLMQTCPFWSELQERGLD